ncbi:MAG: carbohydrate ABC transporter permease [Spirochaetaceae bacterium]|nr:carbohydrate ABC transporter permease [Spirochaetaceae bacterium]
MRNNKKLNHLISSLAGYILIFIMGLIFILPFAWLVSSSFKPTGQLYLVPPRWIPRPPVLTSFTSGWALLPFGSYLWNTIFVALVGALGTVISSALVAYGFARFRSKANPILFVLVISTMMLPNQVTLIPVYQIFSRLKWINTFLPILVPQYFAVGAFYIFLLRQFFRTIPRELDEAAKIDGCNTFRIFLFIMIPLCRPALITVLVFSLINNWNDFMTQLIYLNSEKLYTIAIGLQFFSSKYGPQQINLLMAVSLLTLLPLLFLFFVAQKYFVQGIATTGIKG